MDEEDRSRYDAIFTPNALEKEILNIAVLGAGSFGF